MKINLVSDVTYYPVRSRQMNKPNENQSVNSKQQAESATRFDKILMDKLSSNEASAIRKLFGDFKTDMRADKGVNSNQSDNNREAVTRGRFVDITV